MILIGLGANLPSPRHGPPVQTLTAALAAFPECGVQVVARSNWYRSAPLTIEASAGPDQPWYVNGAAAVTTRLDPTALLDALLALERAFGRVRRARWDPRILDLDLLSYGDRIIDEAGLTLPHPQLHARRFVLRPLIDIAPDWHHPVTGLGVAEMEAKLDPAQVVEPFPDPPVQTDGATT